MVAEGLLVATVAKFVARLWLSDTGDAVDAGIDLATLLSGRIRDRGERLEATAQVNALAREISSTVVQLVRGEDNPEVQAEQQQVILAIECAFKAARLSASSLVEMRLDGHLLAEHVLATAPPLPVGLSEAASETYRRAISATATAMIDCASTLPSYHEMVDKRVLSSLDALLRASEQQEDQFEARYRASAADRMDKLRIFGVDVPNADQAYSLSVAYVSLALEANEEDDGGGEGDADLAIETVLETTPRLLIRGPAGSGKTTLLQWIGVQTARRGFSGSMADWNRMVPFLIRLRNFSEGEFPQPENFARLTAPSVAGEMPPGWVHEKLRNGQAVVLIDGVDELPESKRTAAKEWLQDLNEAFGRATFVVTSREYATGDTWLRDVDFRTVNLLPMTLTNIDAFFHHWHEAAGRSADETTKNRLLSFEDDLKREIRRNRALRMIATSPLLCAMICTLYRARNQALPRHRVELYEACCSMLLERRDIERGIDLSVYPKLTYAQKKRLLSDLAYHMLKNEESEISTERARRRVYERLPSMMPGSSVREHDACFSFLLHRSGLLDEPVVGHVEFRHRTFQEYLAARAALDEEDLQLLIKHAHDDQWREVVLLAVGQASEKASVQLIAGLHERAKEEPTHRHCLQLLAISCLEAATSVPPSVQSATQACVRRLVPPSNLTDAKALATAGELAVPYLSWKRNWLAPCAAASVRCLTLIGTDAALEALESYIQDERKAVRVELLKADASFDGDEFRSRILKPAFARCKEWCIEGQVKLDVLECMPDIYNLTIQRHSTGTLYPIAVLPHLRYLTLSHLDHLSDFRALSELQQLEGLRIRHLSNFSNMSDIAVLPSLSDLQVEAQLPHLDVTPIADHQMLWGLRLNNYGGTLSWPSRVELTRLRTLTILSSARAGSNRIGISALPVGETSMPKLESLSLTAVPFPKLDTLTGCTSLRTLRLSGVNQETDFGPIGELPNIEFIYIYAPRSVPSLQPLTQLRTLRAAVIQTPQRDVQVPESLKSVVRVNIPLRRLK